MEDAKDQRREDPMAHNGNYNVKQPYRSSWSSLSAASMRALSCSVRVAAACSASCAASRRIARRAASVWSLAACTAHVTVCRSRWPQLQHVDVCVSTHQIPCKTVAFLPELQRRPDRAVAWRGLAGAAPGQPHSAAASPAGCPPCQRPHAVCSPVPQPAQRPAQTLLKSWAAHLQHIWC